MLRVVFQLGQTDESQFVCLFAATLKSGVKLNRSNGKTGPGTSVSLPVKRSSAVFQ